MTRKTSLGLVVMAGCGRIGFDDVACARWGPFSTPALVASVSTPAHAEWHAWITRDDRSLYYHVIDTDSGNLVVARRAAATDDFSSPMLLDELNTPGREANPTVSGDERTIVFDSDRRLAGQLDLFIATRTDPALPFDPPVELSAFSTPAFEESASLSPDGLELFFTRAGTETSVQTSTRADTTQPFQIETTVPTGEISGYRTYHVAISPDGRELFLSSNRPGTIGGYDVYVMHRTARGADWDTPTRVAELCSAGDDSVDSMTADGSTIYMAYDADISGLADIYTASRSCAP